MYRTTRPLRALTLGALAALALPAAASDWEWPWEQDDIPEIWSTETIAWAGDIHPANLTTEEIERHAPPPREAWCVDGSEPNENILYTYDLRLANWVRDFLDLPAEAGIDADILDAFPPEC